MEIKGGVGMVNHADRTIIPADAPSRKSDLPITVSLREVVASKFRLEASAYSIEARKAVAELRASGLPLTHLYGKDGLCSEAHNAFRFKRIWVKPEHGVAFITSAEIISMRPRLAGFLSNKLTKKKDDLIIQNGDVLISCSGTIGNVTFAGNTLMGLALSQDALRLRASNHFTAAYVAAFLRSRYGKSQLVQESYGSVVTHIEPEHLANIIIPDLHPVQRGEIGKLFIEAAKCRDEANRLIDEADTILHQKLELPPIVDNEFDTQAKATSMVKASELTGRFEASYHDPQAHNAALKLQNIKANVFTIGHQRVTREIRAITKFRKRVYVSHGGIPMLSSKQLFQVDPIDVKRLAKGAHTKDLPEIALEKNMIAVTCSGTIGRIQIIPEYMHGWTANQHATRLLAAKDMNPGYLYAWLSSDYGQKLLTRHSYGSVILEIDRDMIASVPIPIPAKTIIDEIGDLVLKANELRNQAWEKERSAIKMIENMVSA